MGRKAKSAALKAVPENEESVPEAGASSVDEIMRLIASIDAEGKPELTCKSSSYLENDDLAVDTFLQLQPRSRAKGGLHHVRR